MTDRAIKLPDVGEGITEAELVEWHVKVGDTVREDDLLAAVMTDKATIDVPSLYNGVVTSLGGEIGDMLAIGSDLVMIDTDDDEEDAAESDEAETMPTTEDVAPEITVEKPEKAVAASKTVLASPSVRDRAKAAGLDLTLVSGSGAQGRVTHTDLDAVMSTSEGQPAPRQSGVKATGQTDVKIVGMRRQIAERMSLANERIPHISIIEEVDVTALVELRASMNANRGDRPKLTPLPFIVKALTRAIEACPELNAHYDDEKGLVTQYEAVHVGIATATDAGLVVPVLRHAEALGVFETAGEIARLSDAARDGSASREELTGSTMTITSLGPLGAIATTPIINHPEVAILGVNRMAVRPQWDGTQFVPRKMMNISSSFDHRIIDGWNAAVFVQKIKTLLETPALMFINE